MDDGDNDDEEYDDDEYDDDDDDDNDNDDDDDDDDDDGGDGDEGDHDVDASMDAKFDDFVKHDRQSDKPTNGHTGLLGCYGRIQKYGVYPS